MLIDARERLLNHAGAGAAAWPRRNLGGRVTGYGLLAAMKQILLGIIDFLFGVGLVLLAILIIAAIGGH